MIMLMKQGGLMQILIKIQIDLNISIFQKISKIFARVTEPISRAITFLMLDQRFQTNFHGWYVIEYLLNHRDIKMCFQSFTGGARIFQYSNKCHWLSMRWHNHFRTIYFDCSALHRHRATTSRSSVRNGEWYLRFLN